jgi:hypothetical protein
MLIDLDDLESAITDLDTEPQRLVLGDRSNVPERCPRCEQPMQIAALHRGRERLLPRVVHCAKHGAWLPGGVLVALFAGVGHRASPRASGDENTGGLRIGNWRSKARPRDHVAPVDPHAGKHLACPSGDGTLAFEGDRYRCEGCTGVLLADARLVEMIGEVTGAPYELAAPSGSSSAQRCPACTQPMIAETFATATVARCAEHGFWFPSGALETALAHLVGAPRKLGGFWSRLFGG